MHAIKKENAFKYLSSYLSSIHHYTLHELILTFQPMMILPLEDKLIPLSKSEDDSMMTALEGKKQIKDEMNQRVTQGSPNKETNSSKKVFKSISIQDREIDRIYKKVSE